MKIKRPISGLVPDELRRRLIAQKNITLSPWDVYLESLDLTKRSEARNRIDRYWSDQCNNDRTQRVPLEDGPHLSECRRRLIARDATKLSSPHLTDWELYVNLLYPESKGNQCRDLSRYWNYGLALNDKYNFLETNEPERFGMKKTIVPGLVPDELRRRLMAYLTNQDPALCAGSGR
jgi:hypothetical protein